MSEEFVVEEKGLPEPILVKQTFLRIFWKCLDLFREYKLLDVADDSSKTRIRVELSTSLMAVYMALRNKFDAKQKKIFDDMEVWIKEDSSAEQSLLSVPYLYDCYATIQDKLEELGITRFEMKSLPPEMAVFDE